MGNEKQGDKFTVKNSIDSPYKISWPRLQGGDTALILQEIQSVFQPLESRLKKRKSVNRKRTENRKLEEKAENDPESAKKKIEASKLRSQLLYGINEVTKGLERSQLRLVMVCKSVKPELLTTHLIPLCVSRQTPALCVSSLSNTLAPILGFTSLLAIGFKHCGEDDNPAFDDLVKFVVAKAPPLTVPWLKHREVLTQKIATHKANVKLQHGDSIQSGVCQSDVSENQTGLDETGLDKSSRDSYVILDTTEDLEPPAKRQKLEPQIKEKKKKKQKTETRLKERKTKKRKAEPEVKEKKKKKKKPAKGKIEYQELNVKQMKNIPNEKRQRQKKKRKAAKQK